jgi:hypothetical protein
VFCTEIIEAVEGVSNGTMLLEASKGGGSIGGGHTMPGDPSGATGDAMGGSGITFQEHGPVKSAEDG